MRTLYPHLTQADRESMDEPRWFEFITQALTRDPSEWVIDDVDDHIPNAISCPTRYLVGTGRSQDKVGASVLRRMENEGHVVNVTPHSNAARWALSTELENEEALHKLLQERYRVEAKRRRHQELSRLGAEIQPLIDRIIDRAYLAGLRAGREEAQR
jgi:hypothetical protein